MQIELADPSHASKTVVAAIFALCYLTDRSPRDMADEMFAGLPDEQEWEETILPHILDLPDDYESIS